MSLLQRDGQWGLVQDSHLCSGTSPTPAACRGQCPQLLQSWQCPAQTAYHDFLALANRKCHCSAAHYLPWEKASKNAKQLEHTQTILEGVQGFFHFRDVYGTPEGKVLDFSVTIQELCGHNYFHSRMAGVKDHILYPPKPWRGAMSLSGIQKMPKENTFLE